MSFARLLDHALAEIHTDAERRLERSEQIACAASKLQHPRTLRDQELQVAEILIMKECVTGAPLSPLWRARVGEPENFLFARRYRRGRTRLKGSHRDSLHGNGRFI